MDFRANFVEDKAKFAEKTRANFYVDRFLFKENIAIPNKEFFEGYPFIKFNENRGCHKILIKDKLTFLPKN